MRRMSTTDSTKRMRGLGNRPRTCFRDVLARHHERAHVFAELGDLITQADNHALHILSTSDFIPIFRDFSKGFFRRLLRDSERRLFFPGDTVVMNGQEGPPEMYVVLAGELQGQVLDGTVSYTRGCSWGSQAVLGNSFSWNMTVNAV